MTFLPIPCYWFNTADGLQYEVGRYDVLPGIRWRLLDRDHKVIHESQGAFYDDPDAGTEAIDSAFDAAKAHDAKRQEWLK